MYERLYPLGQRVEKWLGDLTVVVGLAQLALLATLVLVVGALLVARVLL